MDIPAKLDPTTNLAFANDFPVVCVGGSAGGLDVYIRLLRHLPSDLGVAIVIVNHLRHTSTLLHEILPNYTKMPVKLITDRLAIQPNRVFIIPPRRDLHVLRLRSIRATCMSPNRGTRPTSNRIRRTRATSAAGG